MREIQMFIGFILLLNFMSCAGPLEKEAAPSVQQNAKVEAVQRRTVDDFYEAPGTVRAKTRSVIAARIMGNVVAVHVREGDRVRAGQTLIELENRDAGIQQLKARAGVKEAQSTLDEVQRNISSAQSGLEAARAQETLAKATFARYKVLHERRSVSPQEFEEARARFEVASAEGDRAERILEANKARRGQVMARIEQANAEVANANVYAGYARLRSPLNGVVVAKHVDNGSLATPGTPLLTIESTSGYQLEVAVEESQLGRIVARDRAFIVLDALQIPEFSGLVSEIVPASDSNSRSYIVRIDLPDTLAAQIRTGLFGKARFVTGSRETFLIPSKAVVTRGQLTSVFVVDESGITRLRLIKVGKIFNEDTEVLSGLNEGEQIVVSDLTGVIDGGRVYRAPSTSDAGVASR